MLCFLILLRDRVRPLEVLVSEFKSPGAVRKIVIGFSVGIALALITGIAMPHVTGMRLFAGTVLSCLFCFRTVVFLLIVAVCLPVVSESVARLVLQTSLSNLLKPIILIPAVGIVFAMLWPVFGFWAALLLGVSGGLLYNRTRSFLSCIAANASMSICLGAFTVIFAGLR
jgi:membrane protease YdiL (CAAX protease family)